MAEPNIKEINIEQTQADITLENTLEIDTMQLAGSRKQKRNEKKSKNKKRNFRIFFIIILVLALLVSGGGYYVWSVYQNYKETTANLQGKELPDAKAVDRVSESPFTILFIGIGTNGYDGQNSLADSINLLTINPKKNYAEMIAIPRDSYVPFGDTCLWGAGYYDKITHTTGWDAGEAKCLQSTLEDLFDVDINYYISLDFMGFVQIVNALGGVEMEVPDLRAGFEAYPGDPSDGMYLDPALKNGEQWCEHDSYRNAFAVCFNQFGLQTVNGEQALALARSRHYDSDLGRSLRQTELIKAIAKKANGLSGVFSANALLDAIGDSVETNIPAEQFSSFISLASKLFNDEAAEPFTIRTTQLAGRGSTFVGHRITSSAVYYSLVPIASVEDIRRKIAAALTIDDSTTLFVESMNFEIGSDGTTASYSDETLYNNMDVTDPDVVKQFH